MVKEQPDSNWRKRYDLSFSEDQVYYPIKSKYKYPLVKDSLCIFYTERLPWAWARFEHKSNYPIIYTKILPLND